jgi:exodeoxyribonuclease VII small subunit
MSKATKEPGGDIPAPDLPFEDALKKLESIVESMEAEDLPLEKLLAQYQEGARLSQICQERLAQAELRIQQLEKSASGQISVKSASIPPQPTQP